MIRENVILVNGCSDLIGLQICQFLSQKGYTVIGFDSKAPELDIDFVKIDLSSDESVRIGFQHIRSNYGDKITSIIHHSPNVEGTSRLLREAKTFQTEQFLFISSLFIHKSTVPGKKITEESPLQPSKDLKNYVRIENTMHNEHGHIPIVSLRIADYYDDYGNSALLTKQIERVQNSLLRFIYPGNLTYGIPFLHADDLMNAIGLCISKRKELPQEIRLLIGEDRTMSYEGLQKEISRLVRKREIKTIKVPAQLADFVGWTDPVREHYELNLTKARRSIGWQPKHFIGHELPKIISNIS